MSRPRLVILASGRGSNFEAIARAVQLGEIPAEIVGVLSNVAHAKVLQKAAQKGIPTFTLESRPYLQRKERSLYDQHLLERVERLKPDWVVLAGYMLLLGPTFVRAFEGRVVNIHPSLLPAFRGLNAQRQALEARARKTGCTVHIVTEALDDGPLIEQSEIDILPTDTEETLTSRLLPIEHETYVRALRKLCSAWGAKG